MKRLFGDYQFDHICPIEPKRDELGEILIYHPQDRYAKREQIPFNAYGNQDFCKFSIPLQLNLAGVYVLTVNDMPFYVGKCINLLKRYNAGYGNISPRNCYKNGQSTNNRINNLILQEIKLGKSIDLWFYQTTKLREVEKNLIRELGTRDHWNLRD